MAQGTTQRKEDLKRELKLTRELMDYRMEELSEELNYVAKFRNSVKKHPFLWSAGAFLSAFSLVKLFGSSSRSQILVKNDAVSPSTFTAEKKSKKRRILATGLAFTLPFVKNWAINALRDKFYPSDSQH